MIADLKDREPNTVMPFIIVNFSHHEHLHLPKDHIVAFAEKDCNEGNLHHGTVGKGPPQDLDTRKKMTRETERVLREPIHAKRG